MAGIKDSERLKRRMLPKEFLDSQDSFATWARFMNSEDDKIALDCWKYLHDRVYGKPAQSVDMNLGGEVEVIKRVVLGKLG